MIDAISKTKFCQDKYRKINKGFICISLLFIVGCNQSIKEIESAPRLEPLPQVPNIEVYFNQNQAQGADYKDSYRKIKRPGDNLEAIMIESINKAQSSIDLAVQELRLPKLAHALAERHQAGVKVRVILENNYSRPYSEFTEAEIAELEERDSSRYRDYFALMDENKDNRLTQAEINKNDALIVLRNAGIPVIDDTEDGSKGSGLMHHKFMVIDNNIVILGSANLTLSGVHGDYLNPDSRGNTNHILRIKSSQLAAIFQEEFEFMWGDGPGGKKDSKFGLQKPYRSPQTVTVGDTRITVNFSPISRTQPWSKSSNGLIAQTLKKANSTIDLALFVFSKQKLSDVLQKQHQNGVKIRALIDRSFAFRTYSEALDMLGVALSRNCRYEENNNPWQTPINTVGTAQLPSGDKLHHKFGIIDKKIVITGSQNWSQAANYTNDENLVILKNPVIAAHFQREFDRLYSNANLGIPEHIHRRIEEDKQKCKISRDTFNLHK